MNVKEQYWKYSLVVIILLLGTIIFFKLRPFLGGLLGACIAAWTNAAFDFEEKDEKEPGCRFTLE